MSKKKRNWLIGGGVLLLLIIIIMVKGSGGSNKLEVTAESPKERTLTETVIANGNIQPAQDIKISPDVSGEITILNVNEGDVVKQGDLLLRIRPDLYESSVNRSEASLNVSKANLASAKSRLAQSKAQLIIAENTYNRSKKLYEQKAISDAEYEQSFSNFEVAKADVEASVQNVNSAAFQVESAKATVKEARENLSRTTIYAPEAGTISSLSVENGERVVGTSQMAGTELMRISDMNMMEVHVDVNETDIMQVKMGDTAIVEVDSYLDKEFKGIVTEIANASKNATGMSTDRVTNFSVKISILPNSYKELMVGKPAHFSPFRPGMSASVEIITAKKQKALSIPIEAVTVRSDSTGKVEKLAFLNKDEDEKDEEFECVFIIENGKAVLKKIKTGIQDSKHIEILTGLNPAAEVVTGPYSTISKKLENGITVELSSKKDLYSKKD